MEWYSCIVNPLRILTKMPPTSPNENGEHISEIKIGLRWWDVKEFPACFYDKMFHFITNVCSFKIVKKKNSDYKS